MAELSITWRLDNMLIDVEDCCEPISINLGANTRKALSREILDDHVTLENFGRIVTRFRHIPIKLVQDDPDHVSITVGVP